MSLINQMLRDLENRRKTGARQLPSGEGPTVLGEPVSSSRRLYLAVSGLILAGVVWAVWTIVQHPLPVAKHPLLAESSVSTEVKTVQATPVLAVPETPSPAVKTLELSMPVTDAHKSGGETVVGKTEVAQALPQVSPQVDGVAPQSKPVVAVLRALPVEKKQPKLNRVNKKSPTLNREQQAQLAYRTALKQLRGKDLIAAGETFSHALILQPRLLNARLQLIDLLQIQGRNTEAEEQIVFGLQLHPDSPAMRKKYARRLLSAGQPAEAIKLLQAEPQPEMLRDLEYHALLAGLLQETGEYQVAIKVYTQLLNFHPQEALWWMGLAISLDQTGDAVKAKDAYQQAVVLPGLSAALKEYVEGRLQAL